MIIATRGAGLDRKVQGCTPTGSGVKKQLQAVVIWSWRLDLDPRVEALQLVDRRTASAARLCVSASARGSVAS